LKDQLSVSILVPLIHVSEFFKMIELRLLLTIKVTEPLHHMLDLLRPKD